MPTRQGASRLGRVRLQEPIHAEVLHLVEVIDVRFDPVVVGGAHHLPSLVVEVTALPPNGDFTVEVSCGSFDEKVVAVANKAVVGNSPKIGQGWW